MAGTQPGYPRNVSGAERGGEWSDKSAVQCLAFKCRASAWAQRVLGHGRGKTDDGSQRGVGLSADELAPASSRVVGEAGPLISSKVAGCHISQLPNCFSLLLQQLEVHIQSK
jgi:hypothetical protein